MKIGMSGIEGSFSEEAAKTYCRAENVSDFELEYLVSAEGVLSALESGVTDLGIFPVMNSIGGIVIEALYAMSAHDFSILKLFEIEVHQNMLAKKGVNPEHITAVTSHDQALKQCRGYLDRQWPGVERVEYPDTAKAAKDLSEGLLPETTAVIASKAAAERYGLAILDESIQDLKLNYTSFVAAKKRD